MAVFGDGALNDVVHSQDAALRRVDNRRGHHRAEGAAVGDGEGAARHVFDGEAAVFGFGGVVEDAVFDVGKAHQFGVAQDGNDEAAWRGDGDADVAVVVVDDVVAVDGGVHRRVFFQRFNGGFDEEGHEAEFDAVFGDEGVLVFFAQCHHRAHIHFVEGGEHGGVVLRVKQAFGDAFAQAGHRYALFVAAAAAGEVLFDVVFGDASAATATGDFACGNACFGSDFARRRAEGFVVSACGGSRGSGFFRSGRGVCNRAFFDVGDDVAAGDGRAILGGDFFQYAADRGGHFEDDFVGFEIDEVFAFAHAVAGLFVPVNQGRVGDGFGQGGDGYCCCHVGFLIVFP